MSMNWQIRDLVGRLRKTYIAASAIAVGDVIVGDTDQWQVAEIVKEANGFLSVLDEDGNGFGSTPPNQVFVIIDRSCFG